MDERRKLEVALDALAGEFGLLVAAAESPAHARDAEVGDAVGRARDAFASVNEIAASLEEGDLEAVAVLWEVIAVVQDQMQRARDTVREARCLPSRAAEPGGPEERTLADSDRRREERPPAVSSEPLTVLVVDDVADTRQMYTTYFEHAGARVLGADDGAKAQRCLDTQRPDVVLLDLSMPGTDGWDTLAAMRSDPRWRGIPIAILTGCAEPNDREAALVAGADLFLTKPCLPHVVFRLLLQLVRRTA